MDRLQTDSSLNMVLEAVPDIAEEYIDTPKSDPAITVIPRRRLFGKDSFDD